jgi:hypothetical protein
MQAFGHGGCRAGESTKHPRCRAEVSARALGAAAPSSEAAMTAPVATILVVIRLNMIPSSYDRGFYDDQRTGRTL